MSEISKEQERLLEMLDRRRYPPEIAIHRIYEFLKEKPKEEALDPRWKDIWEKYERYAWIVVPPSIIEEIEEILQSIKLVDEDIWKIKIDKNTKITFLLGAGASAPSGIPTVDKLLSELWKRARKIGREDLDRLADWCTDRGISNIEDLLTAAYISNFVARNPNITALLDYFIFSGGRELSEEEYLIRRRRVSRTTEIDVSSISFLQETLQTLFGLLTSTMISASPNPTHKAIVNFIKEHKNTSIITTNYDGCMDEALLKDKIPLKGTISGENEDNPSAVQLIKMHGSINWAYCDSCQDVREFDLLELKKIYEEDELSYPVIGICKKCGGLRRPLLVPPLSFKFLMFPNLIDIWNSARQSIEEADYLIIVGYSFSEADTYITKIISRSMSMKTTQKMVIVNTNSKLVPMLRERFSAHIDGFDEKRILKVCESCEKILPDILDSMLDKKSPKKKTKATEKKNKEE
ncbi:MAG: SIR2 family protein [Methanophagales archaeon]|nr:SIR2 family protein [Methanophagales archaeon]